MHEVTAEEIRGIAKELREFIDEARNFPPKVHLHLAAMQAEILEAWINEDDADSLYDSYMCARYGSDWDRDIEAEEYRDNVMMPDIAAMNCNYGKACNE